MASKKRAGLSSREYAAAQKAKATPKVSTRATASKSPWGSAGDAISGEGSMSTSQYESKIASGLGSAASVAAARNEAKLTSSPTKQREAAAKAQKKKSSAPRVLGTSTNASSLLGTETSAIGGGTVSQGDFSPLDSLRSGIRRGVAGAGRFIGDTVHLPDAGLTEGIGLNNFMRSTLGVPTANAAEGDMSSLGRALQTDENADIQTSPGDSDVNSIFGNLGRPTQSQPFNPSQSSNSFQPVQKKQDEPQRKEWKNPWGDVDISGESAPVPSYSQTQNELYGGGQQPDVVPPQATRQVRGSGMFGTGKGVGSPAGGQDDPYIKELRKAYSSNGGEKWLRKQFEELISALDPTYAQMQKEGTDALNAQLNNDNTKLASVMNANNTGDSEQRAQLMAGQQRDTSTALGNLLAKLSQNKAQDVSGYKTQQAEAMSKYSQNKQQDARTLLEKIQAYRGQQAQGTGRVAGPAVQSTPKLSRNDVFSWVEDALNKGYSWQEIASNAEEQGIGTETGGYLDQLLNQANKQNRYR